MMRIFLLFKVLLLSAVVLPAGALEVRPGSVSGEFSAADCLRTDAGGSRFKSGSGCSNAETVINEDSADIDFRVESDGQSQMLVVDAGTNEVRIGAVSAFASTFTSVGYLAVVSSETIIAAATITADACGGIKIIYAASAIATNTTNTFTAPAASNVGCCMDIVVDRASLNITLDANANFDSAAGVDVVLTAKDSVRVCQTSLYWAQVSAVLAN